MVYFEIINPDLFRSKVSLFKVTKSNMLVAPTSIPKLLPFGISEESINKLSEQAR